MFVSFMRGMRFLRGGLKIAEGPGPHLVEVGTEARDAFGVELVKAAGSGAAVENEACVFQHFEVLRNRGAADGKGARQFVDGERTRRELLKDGHARGVAKSVETGLKVCVHRGRARANGKLNLTVSSY
jgi:hypothetical protein